MGFGWIVLGLLSIGAVAAAFNPLAAVKLASQVSGFLLDAVRKGVAWAREPGRNWWKIGCLTFGALFALAALIAYQRHGAVEQAHLRCDARIEAIEDRLDTVRDAAVTNRDNLLACQNALEDEVGKQADIAKQGEDAVAQAEAAKAKAQKEADQWRKRYHERPKACSAALDALEEPCASLSGY